MRNVYYICLLFSFMLTACDKYDIPKNTPECIIEKVRSLDKKSVCEHPKINEYLFQNETVYVSDFGSCGPDMQAIVYNEDCESIGALGGITGNTIVNGENFSNAEFKRLIWEK